MHERPSDPSRTHRARATAIAALATFSFVALTGCAASTTPEPAPAPTPSLTQEQQDDAAFRDVFTSYVDLDANTDTDDDLAQLLTGNVLKGEKSDLADARRTGERQTGKEIASGFQVTDRGLDPAGLQYMTAQVCVDSSGTRLLDAAGKDVTPQRDTRLSLQVKAIKSEDAVWRISDIVRNEGVHACE